MVHLKRLISDVNVNWNSKIQDLLLTSKRRDEKTRRSESGKPMPPATSHSLEYDQVRDSPPPSATSVSVEVQCLICCNVAQVSSSSSQHPDNLATSQWDDTSSCSEGREDMSPSSPEPPAAVVGTDMTDREDWLTQVSDVRFMLQGAAMELGDTDTSEYIYISPC